MPSQQSSLSGMRTKFARHALIALIDAWSIAPSEKPQPPFSTHADSVPERFTPRSTTACPSALTRRFPETCSGDAAPAGVGAGVGVGVGTRVAAGVGVAVGIPAVTANVAA